MIASIKPELKAMNFAAIDPEDGHIVDLVSKLYAEYLIAKADGKFDLSELYGMFGRIVEIGKHVIEITQYPSAHLNAIVSDLEKLYDTYVMSIDVPGIGPIVENFAKKRVRELIRPMVEALLEDK